jgi:hypothetical protein
VRDLPVLLKRTLHPDEIADPELRARKTTHLDPATQCYIAKDGGLEVGFLAVDVRPMSEYFVIHEIWVPERLRHKGIATLILGGAEEIGRSLGYRKAALRPVSFHEGFPQNHLHAWYIRAGYLPLPNSSCELVKYLF